MTENTRDKLIATSIQIMSVKGFNNTGIAEILSAANVPKGSFYHYFKSKDDLGLAIVESYGQQLRAGFCNHLQNTPGSAMFRLRSYFEAALSYFGNNDLCNCLLGNLAQELAIQNTVMRDAISVHFRAIESAIADCLKQAKTDGELNPTLDEQMLAKMFFSSWEGSLLRAKLEQSLQPLVDLIDVYFSVVFNKP